MKKATYNIEREFLGNISITTFFAHIVRKHLKSERGR